MAQPYTEAWLPGFDGSLFYTREWAAGSPKAVMLFIHGFADHISRYNDVHARWPERGITLFAYDMRGFGKTALDERHRSPGASYGKTNRDLEIRDVDWWLEHLSKKFRGLPLFLMGYSAGGSLALAYATRSHAPPNPDTVTKLSGVISNSPLTILRHPVPVLSRLVGHTLVKVVLNMVVTAHVPEERFSRRLEIPEGLKKDPWRRPAGTLKGLLDTLGLGKELLDVDYQYWPCNLPLLMLHGTADDVNDAKDTEEFYNRVNAKDKKLVLIPDALHDLLHEIGDIPDRTTEECLSWMEGRITRSTE